MKAWMRVCLLLGFCLPATALRAEDIADILKKIQQLRRQTDFEAEGRLIRIEGGGKRTVFRLRLKGKGFAEKLKLRYEVTQPVTARFELQVESSWARPYGMDIYWIHDGKQIAVAPDRLTDAFLGSCLNYEDLVDPHFSWDDQKLVKMERYGDRHCYVIRSRPGSRRLSSYRQVLSWVDVETMAPVYREKYLRDGNRIKEFIYSGLRKSKGFWVARQLEVRVRGASDRTFLILSRGAAGANLGEQDFYPQKK